VVVVGIFADRWKLLKIYRETPLSIFLPFSLNNVSCLRYGEISVLVLLALVLHLSISIVVLFRFVLFYYFFFLFVFAVAVLCRFQLQ